MTTQQTPAQQNTTQQYTTVGAQQDTSTRQERKEKDVRDSVIFQRIEEQVRFKELGFLMNDSWLQGAVKGMNQLAERYKLNRRGEETQGWAKGRRCFYMCGM